MQEQDAKWALEMSKKHIQAELERHEYGALQEAAASEGLTIKDAVREAVLAWARERNRDRDPFFSIIGMGKGLGRRMSEDHDKVLYGGA